MTKQEAINRVNEGVGSIYTKEDVTNLINQIEDTKVETTDEYEIESKVDNCQEALKGWVGATIVEACTIVEELSNDEHNLNEDGVRDNDVPS